MTQNQIERSVYAVLSWFAPDVMRSIGDDWPGISFARILGSDPAPLDFMDRLKRDLWESLPESDAYTAMEKVDRFSHDQPDIGQASPSMLIDFILRSTESIDFDNGSTEPAGSVEDEFLTSRSSSISAAENWTVVPIFFATDRKSYSDDKEQPKFGFQRSEEGLRFGECEISIPRTHRIGRLESPSLMRLEFRPNPGKHILLKKTLMLEEEAFLERVSKRISTSTNRDVLLFVHGYNVTFENAARRLGQLAFDLDSVGAPILYSWPACGHFFNYAADEAQVIWTVPHLERLLMLIAAHSGAERIHLIAHSMGNRAVCDALKLLSYQQPPTPGVLLHHLMLAAPDIDSDTFQDMAARLKTMSGRITLYASSKDKALQLSRTLHQNPRAGEPILILPGVDSIDASGMGTDFLAHSYFSDNWPLLSDIHALVSHDLPPDKRFGLREVIEPRGSFYVFKE